MLLAPECKEQNRENFTHHRQFVDYRVVSRTERDHFMERRNTRRTMMNNDRSFCPTRFAADLAPVTIPSEDPLALSTEVGSISPL